MTTKSKLKVESEKQRAKRFALRAKMEADIDYTIKMPGTTINGGRIGKCPVCGRAGAIYLQGKDGRSLTVYHILRGGDRASEFCEAKLAELLTIDQAADLAGVQPSTIYAHTRGGKIASERPFGPSRILIRPTALAGYIVNTKRGWPAGKVREEVKVGG